MRIGLVGKDVPEPVAAGCEDTELVPSVVKITHTISHALRGIVMVVPL